MSLRPAGVLVKLTDFKGELIALRYDQDITSSHSPEWNDGKETEYTVPRADVVQITRPKKKGEPLVAKNVGRTLVFAQAIANDIRGSKQWAVGELDQVERPILSDPDATMYQLSMPTDVSIEQLEAAFEAAGIDL